MTATTPATRTTTRTRADGERSRRAILLAATRLATTEGLDRLSIADLAAHVGMSKSGLYAHFRSKEELQLATIDEAEAIFDEVVVAPMRGASGDPGGPRPRRSASSTISGAGSSLVAASSPAPRPSSSRAPGRSRTGSPPSTGAGGRTSSTTCGSPATPATCRATRTSTRSSSRSTPTCSTPTRPSRSAAIRPSSIAPPRRCGDDWGRPSERADPRSRALSSLARDHEAADHLDQAVRTGIHVQAPAGARARRRPRTR